MNQMIIKQDYDVYDSMYYAKIQTRPRLRFRRIRERTRARTEVAVVIQNVFLQQRAPVQTEPSSN